MIPAKKIMVALDLQDPALAKKLLKDLAGTGVWVKIGMEAFYSLGPDIVHASKAHGLKVFLDLKVHDIPNTVGQAIKSLISLPIDMLNVHAAGGSDMMKRAHEAVKSKDPSPLLIAVTQLTSTAQTQMNNEQGITGSILESVVRYARMAKDCGCDGVVSSALEVEEIKKNCGPNFLAVTPGIRPKGSNTNDQNRTTTPLEALELGSDFMVIGRPITGSPDPKKALINLLAGEQQ